MWVDCDFGLVSGHIEQQNFAVVTRGDVNFRLAVDRRAIARDKPGFAKARRATPTNPDPGAITPAATVLIPPRGKRTSIV